MTQRCLSIRLKEHATRLSSSAVGEHFSECEHAQYVVSLQNQFTLLNDFPLPSDNPFSYRDPCSQQLQNTPLSQI